MIELFDRVALACLWLLSRGWCAVGIAGGAALALAQGGSPFLVMVELLIALGMPLGVWGRGHRRMQDLQRDRGERR